MNSDKEELYLSNLFDKWYSRNASEVNSGELRKELARRSWIACAKALGTTELKTRIEKYRSVIRDIDTLPYQEKENAINLARYNLLMSLDSLFEPVIEKRSDPVTSEIVGVVRFETR